MRDRSSKQNRSAKERCDLEVLLREAIRSASRLPISGEAAPRIGDDIDSHRRGPMGRVWARIQWSWEFGALRRSWLQLWPLREHAEARRPRWAVAQALTALVLPGAVLYLFLWSQLDVAQIVIAMRIGLSVLGRGW